MVYPLHERSLYPPLHHSSNDANTVAFDASYHCCDRHRALGESIASAHTSPRADAFVWSEACGDDCGFAFIDFLDRRGARALHNAFV